MDKCIATEQYSTRGLFSALVVPSKIGFAPLATGKVLSATTSAMASQYWLPPEVWTMVFQMFSEEDYDIESVRLTCKIFEELATPFLLSPPRIICAPLSGSLATLTAVSRHPVFSKSVTEVVYDCNRYHFVKTITEYKEALRGANPLFGKFKEPKSEEEERDLKTAFS
ncbi:hypothetical protein V500_05259, partial [Pseudogymnoascus sp. VKM F-4518 (FW-2643)]